MKKIFFTILIILLAVGAFFLGKNFEQKDSKENNKVTDGENNGESSRNLTDSEKEELISMIEKGYNIYLSGYFSEMDSENVQKITNQELLTIGYHLLYLETDFSLVDDNSNYNSFKGSQLKDVLIKYFGTNKSIILEDIICDADNEILYKYDKNSDTYTFNDINNIHAHGGSEKISSSKILIIEDKIENESEITIKAKVLYGNYCGSTCAPDNAYYSSYRDSKNHQVPVIGDYNSDSEIELTDSLIKENQNKIPTTTYKLIKDNNGNYELKSVTIE